MNKTEFDTDLYPRRLIMQAIYDYEDLCHIEIELQDKNIICSFSDCRYDTQITIKEFGNYIVDLMNSKD